MVEEVDTLAAHEARRVSPDGYRPEVCGACGGWVLHIHDYRVRRPRGGGGWPTVIITVRYRCYLCWAIWLVLPGFLARHLWRAWDVVEVATAVTPVTPAAARRVKLPDKTVRRWRDTLLCSALMLVVALVASGGEMQESVGKEVGLVGTRLELVNVQRRQLDAAHPLWELAVLVHRLQPGLRLM